MVCDDSGVYSSIAFLSHSTTLKSAFDQYLLFIVSLQTPNQGAAAEETHATGSTLNSATAHPNCFNRFACFESSFFPSTQTVYG